MALHRFVPTHFHNVLGTGDPVLEIADGDTVITTTLDAGGRDHGNVLTGRLTRRPGQCGWLSRPPLLRILFSRSGP
jgi:hypothetical protein